MKIITIATQKGGSGKTTLATNLAVAATEVRHTTLLIDTDWQKTSLEWFMKRDNQENPVVLDVNNQDGLLDMVERAKTLKIDRIYIDTQGADSNLVNTAIKLSDFCILPCSSGGFDIGAQRKTAEVVKRLNKEAVFVITKSPSRGQEASETRSILSGLGLQISPCQTTFLKAYKDAGLFSTTVLEDEPKSKAATEIRALFNWIENKLKKSPLIQELKGEVEHAQC